MPAPSPGAHPAVSFTYLYFLSMKSKQVVCQSLRQNQKNLEPPLDLFKSDRVRSYTNKLLTAEMNVRKQT